MRKPKPQPYGVITPEVLAALQAVAKAAGLTIVDECTYCREHCHSECPGELHTILTFCGPAPPDEEF